MKNKNKNAFTLVELLVVISIIALLLSILMPSLSKAREQARMIVCRTNQKNLVMGAKLWSNDNDDWAVAGDWWKDKGDNETESSITPYISASRDNVGDVLTCPSAKSVKFFGNNKSYPTGGQEFSFNFAVNGYLCYNYDNGKAMTPGVRLGGAPGRGNGGNTGKDGVYWTVHGITKMSSIRLPADTLYFIGHEYYFVADWFFNPRVAPEKANSSSQWWFRTRWHKSGKAPNKYYGVGNIAWVDGHSSLEPSDFADIGSNGKGRWKYYFYDH